MFVKGQPKIGGRRRGAPNRFTGEFRAALRLAFDRLGGVDALVNWGRTNPDAFYALCGRLIPTEIAAPGGGVTVIVNRHGDCGQDRVIEHRPSPARLLPLP